MDLCERTSGHRCGRLPRASGDGPTVAVATTPEGLAPPRERGWTLLDAWCDPSCQGSPARAGMDPQSAVICSAWSRLPRASGDGPSPGSRKRGWQLAPPRERGWTPIEGRLLAEQAGSPARAGMDPTRSSLLTAASRLPRASGDGPCRKAQRCSLVLAPPRERGWTLPSATIAARVCGSPARAGMDPTTAHSRLAMPRLPRASGDGPCCFAMAAFCSLAPPRERGWTLVGDHLAARAFGSPARAGMDPMQALHEKARAGLPRASGDGPHDRWWRRRSWRAPPRERGWTFDKVSEDIDTMGSPARAGMDPARPS